MSWINLRKVSKITFSALSGVSFYYYLSDPKVKTVHSSWTTNFAPAEWDFNWDHRAATSFVKPLPQNATEDKENVYNKKLEKHKSKATRHIILIRHGQYHLNGATDKERYLTELGRQQAKFTGKRLVELKIPIDDVVISTMTRAQETGNIILEQIPQRKTIPVINDPLIEEGAPIAPG